MIDKVKLFRVFLIFFTFLAFASVFVGYWDVFVPFVVGLIITYLIDPIVVFMEKRFSMSRSLAATLVFLFFIAIAAGSVVLIYPFLANGVGKLLDTVVHNESQISDFFSKAFRWVEGILQPLNLEKGKVLAKVTTAAQGFMEKFFVSMSGLVLSLISSIPKMFMLLLIVFYFLKDKYKMFAVLRKYTADEREQKFRVFFADVHKQLGGWLRGQFMLSLVVFVVTTVAMLLLGIPYAVLIGLANGVLNIIPYFGPVIGALPGVILAIISFQGVDFVTPVLQDIVVVSSSGPLLGVIIFFVVMNILVSAIVSPKIFASSTNLHPLVVVLAIFLGSAMLGMVGMIVAIPLAIVAKTIISLVFNVYIKEI